MANPAADARAKAQANYPGATVVERGRNHIKHQHPSESGRYVLDVSIGPMHIDGTETEIDTDWQPSTGAWQWEMVLADFHLHARDTFNAGNLIEYRDPTSDEWVVFDPQSINWIDQDTSRQQIAIKQGVSAQVTGDLLQFPAGYGAGVDFVYEAQTGRLKKWIEIDSFATLPAPTVAGPDIWFEAEFSISMSSGIEAYIDGVLWDKANGVRYQTGDRVEFRDAATGQQVFWYLDFPRAKTDDEEVIGQFEFRRQGGPSNLFVTVRIPYDWMATATYPVRVDPTVNPQVAASTDDATSNGYTASAATDTASANPRMQSSNPLNAWRWDGVTVPNGATINDASFDLYGDHPTLTDFDGVLDMEAADDPATFTAGANGNLTDNSRTFTGNTVTGDMTISSSAFTTSPSFVSACQAVVDRAGWASGQAMVLRADYASGTGSAQWKSYDDTTTLAAKLFIDYTAGGAAGDIIAPISRKLWGVRNHLIRR